MGMGRGGTEVLRIAQATLVVAITTNGHEPDEVRPGIVAEFNDHRDIVRQIGKGLGQVDLAAQGIKREV